MHQVSHALRYSKNYDLVPFALPSRSRTFTVPLQYRYSTVTVFGPPLPTVTVFCQRLHTVTLPLPYRYLTVTVPLPTVTAPLPTVTVPLPTVTHRPTVTGRY